MSAQQLDRLETLLTIGDREGVVTTFFGEVLGVSPDQLKSSPAWPGRIAAAHTLPRELRAEDAYRLEAGRIGKLLMPVLLLLGGDSLPFFARVISELEKILTNARTVVMPGQQHIAMDTGPDLLVAAILDFWREVA